MQPDHHALLRHARSRHQRLLAEAETHRTVRLARAGTTGAGLRAATAAFLRALAARVEPRGRGRLA